MSIRVALLMGLCVGLCAGAQPKPATPGKSAAVTQAVAALTKEYQAYAKDAKANKIREKCDYFTQNPSPDATPDAIMKALEGSVAGNADVQAYVKWQLLSGIPQKFPDDMVKRALAVYKRAPRPYDHPGLNKGALNKAKTGLKKEQVGEMNKDFDVLVAKNVEANKPILGYRDELFARLPSNKQDTISAGLDDVADRAAAGLNANAIFDTVTAGIKSWALMEGKPSGMHGFADRIAALKDATARDENKPFTKLAENKNVISWTAAATIDPKKCDEVVKFLDQTASSPTGGLKFKDK